MTENGKLKVLDLFSGIGGFSLGLERTGGFETVAFCEIDPFCRQVLEKHWPDVPIHEDVRDLTADAVGHIDVITGGYPCQPFSLAGKRAGEEDDRHLWPEVKRLVAAIRPRWCLFENVFGHISMGLDEVLSDLDNEGYTAWPLVIPACAVDAPHRRNRVWIVGHTEHNGRNGAHTDARRAKEQQPGVREVGEPTGTSSPFNVADPSSIHAQGFQNRPGEVESWGGSGWKPEPPVGRVANGIPRRVDRLKSLGNAVVPQIPEIIGRAIILADSESEASP